MKKERITLLLIICIIVFSITSCRKTSNPSNKMSFNDVLFVNEFPETYTISGEQAMEVNPDIIGIYDFCIYDSLFILLKKAKKGLWAFYSLPDFSYLGSFLNQGEGPFEFLNYPSLTSNTFSNKNGNIHAILYDFYKGKLYDMNISESIRNEKLNISLINDTLSRTLFSFKLINDTTIFYRTPENNDRQLTRYLLTNNGIQVPQCMELLNKAIIDERKDFNVLSSIIQYSPAKNMIIEAGVRQNFINMYSIDCSFSKTICTEEKIDNIDIVQSRSRFESKYMYGNVRLYTDCWAALYINETSFDKGRQKYKNHPEIQFFDWEGNPLFKIIMGVPITCFEVDFANGFLYTLDYATDNFFKYDIKHILNKTYEK